MLGVYFCLKQTSSQSFRHTVWWPLIQKCKPDLFQWAAQVFVKHAAGEQGQFCWNSPTRFEENKPNCFLCLKKPHTAPGYYSTDGKELQSVGEDVTVKGWREIYLWEVFQLFDPRIKWISLSRKVSYPQGAEDFSVEAADLAGSIVQSQDLSVAVAVAIIGYLPSAEEWLLGITEKRQWSNIV